MMENFIFQWINFIILISGLVYLLRLPLKEFFSKRRELIRSHIVKARHRHEEAAARNKTCRARLENVNADAKSVKNSLVETGSFGRETAVKRARETADRLKAETETAMRQERARAQAALSKETLAMAFEESRKRLSGGVADEDQLRLVDESLTTFR